MELLEHVRDIGSDTPALDEGALNTARQSLLREIAREGRAGGRNRSTRGRWIGGSALVGGAAAAALVVAVLANPVTTPTAAAAVLDAAATTTLTTEALTPAPGQYIRLDETYEQHERGFVPVEGTELDVDYTVTSPRSLFVPAVRTDDWIWQALPQTVTVTRGDAALAGDIAASLDIGTPTGIAGVAPIEAYPGGRIMAGDGWRDHIYRLNGMEQYYDEMPRDPAQLIAWINGYEPVFGASPPTLVDLYGFNLAPPDLRATIFRALALQEAASILSVDGDTTTIAYPESGESTSRAIIAVDTARGLIVGYGYEEVDDDGNASVSDDFGRLTISIVDSAPVGVRIDG